MVRPCVFALGLLLCRASLPGCAQESSASSSASVPGAGSTMATAGVPAASAGEPIPIASHVRIVRLSQVQGVARLDRGTGRGLEPAFANIPITNGARLVTGEGTAEVEFEDGSTLRLAPETAIQFTELGRTAAGQTVSVGRLERGTAYLSLQRTPGARFALTAEQVVLNVHPGSHLRFDLDSGHAQLAVMDGAVDLQGPAGDTVVAKKQSTRFEPLGTAPYEIAGTIQPEPFDGWDRDAAKFQQRYGTASFSGGSGMLFGSADLNYYGSFADMPGCGSLWRPYFASAAWNPYSAGTWAWYPGAGYSWVSPYPWGWMPFHSGSWQNCPGSGWGWSPSSTWYGLGNQPVLLLRSAAVGRGRLPLPPTAPRPGQPHYVASGLAELQSSKLTAPGVFTFRADSAGMGVPRETFGNLRSPAGAVAHHGSTNREASVGLLGAGQTGAGAEIPSAALAMHPVAVLSRGGAGRNDEGLSTMPGTGRMSGGARTSAGYTGGRSFGGAGAPSGMGAGSHMGGGASAGAGGSISSGGGGHH